MLKSAIGETLAAGQQGPEGPIPLPAERQRRPLQGGHRPPGLAGESAPGATPKVLLIEDDEVDRMAFGRMIEKESLAYRWRYAASLAEARERAEAVLESVGMADAMHRKIRGYSKGMRQRAKVAAALALVVKEAFTPTAASGGFAGATVMMAIRMGVARGVFSNESGLGSAPIAAAAAQTKHPVLQALVSMTQTFIDTIIVCTLTGHGLKDPDTAASGFAMPDPVTPVLDAVLESLGW